MAAARMGSGERLFRAGRYAQARAAFERELAKSPDSHWLLGRIGTCIYEERRYAESLPWTDRGLAIQPRCPLLLWDRASCLEMLGRTDEATEIWKGLIKRSASRLARDPCGESLSRARSLVNDCRFRLGKVYARRGDRDTAARYLRRYIRECQRGVGTIYGIREAKRRLAALAG